MTTESVEERADRIRPGYLLAGRGGPRAAATEKKRFLSVPEVSGMTGWGRREKVGEEDSHRWSAGDEGGREGNTGTTPRGVDKHSETDFDKAVSRGNTEGGVTVDWAELRFEGKSKIGPKSERMAA